ncbi:hypothetical protein GCM10029992_61240 [Glycomyces albus]
MAPAQQDFTDKVVVVTGAGSGIGRATTRAFSEAGARVLGVGRRRHALEQTAADDPAIGVHSADLREPGAPQQVIDTAVDRWGRLDILVNNAGATRMMPLDQTTAAGIEDLFALNVTAPSMLAGAALPHLRQSGGTVVNVSSTFGHRPLPHAAHYAASKAALEQLTRSWALELAPDRIRVNAVAPGPTESEALAAAGLSEADVEAFKRDEAARIPSAAAANPKRSPPGSCTCPTRPPPGSPARSSPSTAASNSPDRHGRPDGNDVFRGGTFQSGRIRFGRGRIACGHSL